MAEAPDGRTLLRTLTRGFNSAATPFLEQSDTLLPSIREYADRITMSKRLELIHSTPELRFTETDQTDPAGRYRFDLGGDVFRLQRALTAAWATQTTLLSITGTGTAGASWNAPNDGSAFSIIGGLASSTGSAISLYGKDNNDSRVEIMTPNAANTARVIRLLLTGDVAQAQLQFSSISSFSLDQTINHIVTDAGNNSVSILHKFTHNTSGTPANGIGAGIQFGVETSTTESEVAGAINTLWRTVTHASRTAEMQLDVVVNAVQETYVALRGGTETLLLRPNVNILTSATVPTTTTLDANYIRFVVTAADALIAYRNKAGVIQSYTIGTLA